MRNLVGHIGHSSRVKEMRQKMQQDLQAIGRPFGEFIPGGNAAKPGQISKQIKIVKQLEIKGKTVTVPEALKQDIDVTDEPPHVDKAKEERNVKYVETPEKKPGRRRGKRAKKAKWSKVKI